MIGPTARCPEGIALVLLDLDGTILVDHAVIHARVVDAIAQARERGCMVCVSSGRAYHMVPQMLRRPEVMDYHLCANGACVHDTFGGVLHERLMSREDVLAAFDALAPLRPGWYAFVGERSLFEWRSASYMLTGSRVPLEEGSTPRKALHTGGLLRKGRKALRFARRVVAGGESMRQVRSVRPAIEAAEDGVPKLGCSFASRKKCDQAVAILDELGLFEVARMSAGELEITARGANKGTAALWLMDYLNVPAQQVVAFGDSENDMPLAEVCGTFVAMGNADASVRAGADDVCETADDDGVARWLERAMAETDGARHV